MSIALTPEQVAHFQSEGWLAIPDFWTSDEVHAMQNELERLRAEGLLNNVATNGDGKTTSSAKANLQLCPMYPHSNFFRAMPWSPKVGEAVEQLIGGPVLLHLDQVFLKPAHHGAGTNWHQDNAYFQIDNPLDGTALWTAVHDATVANGTMRIIPRAFSSLLEHQRDPDSNHHIRCWPDESQAVTVELPAGGALFFAYGTPHCTGANSTGHDRAGVALHFIRQTASSSAHGGFAGAKRPVLTGPEARGGEDIYGVPVSGTWDAEVEAQLKVPA